MADCCNFTVDSASLSRRKVTGSGLVSLQEHLKRVLALSHFLCAESADMQFQVAKSHLFNFN